ncbi:helix-turn-helix transcriptional regulator [Halorientalis brevis]|uniref:Helix-turn-helix transcriptional regulator n=1 Tax=Halorientalis brevis TaxID=1126241 RepID=A0ABD6C812_9EURY|nr:hypothetical protein [Halorientalis brevis]
MLSRARVALLALLLVLVTAGQVAAPATANPAPAVDRAVQQSDAATPTPSETTFRVQLRPNGDARWTVQMNFSLATDARREAFETFAAQFEATADSQTLTAFRQANRAAGETTDRQMSITDVERTTRTTNGTGHLVVRFTWTNFSRQTNSSLHVDDVFNTTSGTWLDGLDDGQSLVVVPPKEYSLVDASPPGYAVSNRSVRWDGERTFAPGDISITYEKGDQRGSFPFPLLVVGLVAAGLGVVAVLAFLFSTSDVGLPAPLAISTDDGDGDGTTSSSDGGTVTDAAGTASAATEPVDHDEQPDDEIDEELLSDEERIERLLDQNGGRMKQANIVTETGWSNAKVSQLLSAMDEEDRIDKLRIGRENLISFPDEDITDTNGEEP